MKISELIKQLEELKQEHGDIDVEANDECGSLRIINKRDVYEFKGKVIIDA